MTIPSSPISASNINVELGGSSTDNLSLNTQRVRSLVSNLTAGSGISMSSFAGKAARWFMDITYGGPAISYTLYSQCDSIFSQVTPVGTQETYTRINCTFDGTNYSQTYLTTYYLNGSVARQAAYYNTAYPTTTVVIAAKGGNTTTSNIYTINADSSVGSGKDYIAKLSYTGTVISAKYITDAFFLVGTSDNNMCVDAYENSYVQMGKFSSGYAGIVASFDSNLNFRWAKTLTNPTPTTQSTSK